MGRFPELTDADATAWVRAEGIIYQRLREDRRAGWVEIGCELTRIRDQRWYRITHPSFEAYLRQMFGLTRSAAYRYIAAYRPIAHVSAWRGDSWVLEAARA